MRGGPILPKPVREPTSFRCSDDARTTVMLRNLPNNYTRGMLIDLLSVQGFSGQYDFLYLPMDFNSRVNLGYAFLNLVSLEATQHFWRVFDGFSAWAVPSRKVSGVSWSKHQGLAAQIERYRGSPLLTREAPDEFKPMIFAQGVRVDFPGHRRA